MLAAILILLGLVLCAQTDPTAEAQKAQDLVATGKPDQAVGIYRDLTYRFPSNATLRVNLCIAEFQARRYREAITDAQEALKLQPGLASAELFLGASRLELGDSLGAIEPLERAWAQQPSDRNAVVFLAEALLGAGRMQEAQERFERAAEMAPENPKVWYGLGRSSEAVSDRSTAEHAWQRLRSLPPSPESYMHESAAREQAGEYVEAAKLWRAALQISPRDTRLETGLVWALYKARDHAAALPLIDGLLSKNPESAELNFLRGACLINLEEPGKGLPYLEKAVSLDPGLLPAQAALGQALLRIRKAAQAIPHLQAALSIDHEGSVHFQLYRAYQISGQVEDARRALAEYEEVVKGR